jgi:hypothetical protein
MRKHDSNNALLELIRPECEPCPPHARCYPGMELDCVDDYIKVNSYLSLGGLWPIPPACVPDTEKERRVMIMSDAALDILRKSGAEQRCKEKFLSGGMDLEGVSEADLRQVLYDRKAVSPLLCYLPSLLSPSELRIAHWMASTNADYLTYIAVFVRSRILRALETCFRGCVEP